MALEPTEALFANYPLPVPYDKAPKLQNSVLGHFVPLILTLVLFCVSYILSNLTIAFGLQEKEHLVCIMECIYKIHYIAYDGDRKLNTTYLKERFSSDSSLEEAFLI